MVQNHNVVHCNKKKKRSPSSRSKLLIQVSTLRENNKLLAKAVAEKALKINELENAGLSYQNLKLESRESIKSFREYVFNLEALVKKAVTELAGLVNQFTGILSTTKKEKAKVDFLSTLIEDENCLSTATELYSLRNRTVLTDEPLKSSVSKKVCRSKARRVHPMNLRNTVCILEPVDERTDTVHNAALEKEDGKVEREGSRQSSEKNYERKVKTETFRQINTCNTIKEECDTSSQSSNAEDEGGELLQVVVKQEVMSPKNNSDTEFPALSTISEVSSILNDRQRNISAALDNLAIQKLRPRKNIFHTEPLDTPFEKKGEKTRKNRAKPCSEGTENQMNPREKITYEKLNHKRNQKKSSFTFSEHQIKEEQSQHSSVSTESNTSHEGKILKIQRLRPSSRLNDTKTPSTRKHHVARRASRVPSCATDESVKNVVSAITCSDEVYSNSEFLFRSISENDHAGQNRSYLVKLGDTQCISIKQEVPSPKSNYNDNASDILKESKDLKKSMSKSTNLDFQAMDNCR